MSYIEKFWRDATAADVARVMAGEAVEARFRDCASDEWKCRALVGWSRGGESDDFVWASIGLFYYRLCQVYDPQQWYLDKPDPGEGYRLLGKDPDEALQPWDEALWPGVGWKPSERAERGETQLEGYWYRRRIEQPKPEPKFKVGQRVKIIGGISGPYIGKLAIIEAMTIEPTGWFYELRHVEGSFHEPNLEPVAPKHYSLKVGDTCDVPSGHRLAVTEHGVEVT